LAYKLHQANAKDAKIAELEKQLGIKKTNETNADSSMGAVTGAEGEMELNEEVVKKMTSEQKRANMPRILKWMRGE
jgi:hypothetical protein